MPVHEDSSIVPDSTLSSSPIPATPAIRRAHRTYGRPRADDTVDDSDTSRFETASSSQSRDSIYKTGPLKLDEEIPPSSDPITSQDDDETESASQGASSKYQFAWRKKLQEYDEQEDIEMNSGALDPRVDPPILDKREILDAPTSPARDDSSTLVNDVFGGSLDTITTSPSPSSRHSSNVGTLRRRYKRVIQDSDSEGDENKVLSPSHPFPIATPRNQSSQTPPTSDDDLPTRLMSKGNLKGKGKAKARAHSEAAEPEPVEEETSPERQKATKEKRRQSKVKAPTKRELRETARNRVRIAVDQEASIPRVEYTTHKYTIQSLLKHVAVESSAALPEGSDADPIGEFSSDAQFSSQNVPALGPSFLRPKPGSPSHASLERPRTESPLKVMASIPDFDPDDLDLPDVADLVAQEKQDRNKGRQYQDFLEQKMRLLAAQQTRPQFDDDDDDLKVVPSVDMQIKEEDAERKSGRKKRMSQGRQKVLKFAGVAARAKESPLKGDGLRARKVVGLSQGGFKNPHELNQFMAKKVETERITVVRQKEAHWKELGGKVGKGPEAYLSTAHEAAKLYAQQGLEVMGNGKASTVEEGSEDGSDGDWEPDVREHQRRGSRSPSNKSHSDDDDDDDEEDDADESGDVEDDADVTMVDEEGKVMLGDDADMSSQKPLKPLARRSKARLLVHSDSEEENVSPARTLVSPTAPKEHRANSLSRNEEMVGGVFELVHRGSISSFDERTEDEGDKENDTSRMWDHGENKENKAVVRHATEHSRLPFGIAKGSPHDIKTGSSRGLATSPTRYAGDENDDEGDRRPFKDLLDADPFTSQAGPSRSPTTFTARLQQASPVASLPLTASSAVAPLFGSRGAAFSQFEDETPGSFEAIPLQPGFDFGSERQTKKGTPRNKPGKLFGLAKLFTEADTPDIRKPTFNDDLGLTQDVALQPAFQIAGNALRKADQIFEKEQEYLLEAATRKPQNKPELYVNDHGFLTQTRPNIASPEVYKLPSATQSPAFGPSEVQPSQRRPLQTISLAETDFESVRPLQRLHKRATTPPSPLGQRPSLPFSPTLAKRPVKNAFDVMANAAKRQGGEPRQTLQLSEFVENEAQESDDDEMLGFGLKKKDDYDEEDGEDLDKPLEVLVDDRDMEADEVAADLVHEKFQEHIEKDDLEIEKLHQAAIHGELRKKKRGHGVNLDDGDDDSDEDHADNRRRRNMYKKPKINRDNIKELGEDPETKSFYDVYEQDLSGENMEFGYLAESQPLDIVMEDDVKDTKEEEEEEEQDRFVTRDEITRRVRELPEQEEPEDVFDPHNVGWIDERDSDEEHTRVKIQKRSKVHPRRQDRFDAADTGPEGATHRPVTTELGRMQSWAKTEGRSRTLGTTGRSVVGAAVTGHKVKTGGGSLRKVAESASTAPSKSSESRRGVKAHNSLLAGVAAERRNTRFG